MSDTNLPPISKLLEHAQYQYAVGDFEGTKKSAEQYLTSDDEILVQDAMRIVALADFQLKNFDKAEDLWAKVAGQSSRTIDWFNLATSSTLNSNLTEGKVAFDRAVELCADEKGDGAPNPIIMRFHYINTLVEASEFERAFEELEILEKFYTNSGVTDATHLTLSAGAMIPSFFTWLESAKPVLKKIDKEKAKEWLERIKSKVDEEGKATILTIEEDLKNEE